MTPEKVQCATPGCEREVEPLPGRTKCCISCVDEPKGVHLAWCRRRNGDPEPDVSMSDTYGHEEEHLAADHMNEHEFMRCEVCNPSESADSNRAPVDVSQRPEKGQSPCRCVWVEGYGMDRTACRLDVHDDYCENRACCSPRGHDGPCDERGPL